jgi:NAD(P)-dependent dehydrogenase (short-subunit alcohol dehydrogenase family)
MRGSGRAPNGRLDFAGDRHATATEKRPAQPEEIAPAFVFLAAPSCSSYITGEILPIIGRRVGPERDALAVLAPWLVQLASRYLHALVKRDARPRFSFKV